MGTASATIVVYPLPTVTVQDSLIVTGGLADLIANTNAVNPTYLWSTGDTTQRITVYQPGIYSVIVTDGETGCHNEGQATVQPIGFPLLYVETDNAFFCEGGQGTLTANTTVPAPSYLWSTGETTQSIRVTEAGSYQVTVTSGEVVWTGSAEGLATVYPNPVAALRPMTLSILRCRFSSPICPA